MAKELIPAQVSCALCGGPGPIRQSHIIPGFAFDWLKDSSATGFLRYGPEPNLRVQDGFKQELLCDACEQKLSVWEKLAAESVFRPYHADTSVKVEYGPWLAKFAASLAWRVLFVLKTMGLENLTTEQLSSADRALRVWREFMFDERAHPGSYELHLLPVDLLASTTRTKLPPNINRYLARAIEMDVPATPRSVVVYSKLCKLVFVGLVETPVMREWHGTRLGIKQGILQPGKFVVPTGFADYMSDRATRMRELMQGLSERQREKTAASMRKNLDRAAASETFVALNHDIAMFGNDAFAEEAG